MCIRDRAYAVRAYSYFMLAQMFSRTYKGHESEPCVPFYTCLLYTSIPVRCYSVHKIPEVLRLIFLNFLNISKLPKIVCTCLLYTSFNEVQEGFRQINEDENRVDLKSGSISENSADKIKEDSRT